MVDVMEYENVFDVFFFVGKIVKGVEFFFNF